MKTNKPRDYWRRMDTKTFLKEVKRVMKENQWSILPGEKELRESGQGILPEVARRYHGGMFKVRELLGQGQKVVPKGTWKDLQYTISQALQVLEENEWDNLPGGEVLSRRGYSSLSQAIIHYHGGFHKFRGLLGQVKRRVPSGSWKDLDFGLSEAFRIMEEEGWAELPGEQELKKKGYAMIASSARKYYGGMRRFREILEERMTGSSERNKLNSLLEQYANQR